MRIQLDGALSYTSLELTYRGRTITLDRVLVDTGSETTVFAVDAVQPLGITPLLDDKVEIVRGVGGRELVFSRQLDRLALGGRFLAPFRADFGGLDYGFHINGILGMDFLVPTKALIDYLLLDIRFPDPCP